MPVTANQNLSHRSQKHLFHLIVPTPTLTRTYFPGKNLRRCLPGDLLLAQMKIQLIPLPLIMIRCLLLKLLKISNVSTVDYNSVAETAFTNTNWESTRVKMPRKFKASTSFVQTAKKTNLGKITHPTSSLRTSFYNVITITVIFITILIVTLT